MSDPEYTDLSAAAGFVQRIVERAQSEDLGALRLGLARSEVARAAPKARRHARRRGRPDIQALADDLVVSCMAKLYELEGRPLVSRWLRHACDFQKNLEAYDKATH
jgi:hypothetical protein